MKSIEENVKNIAYNKNIALFCIFILLAIFYGFNGYKEPIPLYMVGTRFILAVFCLSSVIIGIKSRINFSLLLKFSTIGTLLLVFLLRFFFMNNGEDVFGPSYDSYSYLTYGSSFSNLTYFSFLDKLIFIGFNRDDFGFFSIVYWVAQVVHDKYYIATILAILNVLILYYSAMYLYKLGVMLGTNQMVAKIASITWITFPFLVVTIACGLKEVIFCSIIIFAMYHINAYKVRTSIVNLLYALLFIVFAFFFRTAIGLMLILSLLVCLVITQNNKKKIMFLGVLSVLLMNVLLSFVIGLMGTDSDSVMATASARMSAKESSGGVSLVLPFVASLLGPFPNMNRTDSYGFIHGYGLFLKCGLSFFFLYGVWNKLKKIDIRWIPIIVFIFCNILMLIIAGTTLDMRYHITYIPFFFLLVFDTMQVYKYKYYFFYTIFVLVLVFIYNTRALN